MKKPCLPLSLLMMPLIVFALHCPAQQITAPKYEMGVRLSSLIYQGDLAPAAAGSYKSLALGGGIFATRIFDWNWALRVSADYGKIKGSDSLYQEAWRKERRFSFRTTFAELAAEMVYTIGDNYRADRLQPYVFAGAGVSFLDVKRDYSHSDPSYFSYNPWSANGLAIDTAKSLPKTCLVFPVGVGLRFGIGDNLSFFGEGTYRLMSTDYLDGFSRSANPSLLDHYTNLSLGLIYRFGDNYINCPRF
ncbi:MAG TPA: DUF6089 family protein [Chitinophagaceae bacterium]